MDGRPLAEYRTCRCGQSACGFGRLVIHNAFHHDSADNGIYDDANNGIAFVCGLDMSEHGSISRGWRVLASRCLAANPYA